MYIWDEWPQYFRRLNAVLAQLERKRKILERLQQVVSLSRQRPESNGECSSSRDVKEFLD